MTIAAAIDPDDVVQTLYLSFLGRAADPAGRDFLTRFVDLGDPAAVDALGDVFLSSQEFRDSFAASSSESYVRSVYFNLFDRNAGVDEVELWTDRLDDGGLDRADLPGAILENARSPIWKPTKRSSSSPTTSRTKQDGAVGCPTR